MQKQVKNGCLCSKQQRRCLSERVKLPFAFAPCAPRSCLYASLVCASVFSVFGCRVFGVRSCATHGVFKFSIGTFVGNVFVCVACICSGNVFGVFFSCKADDAPSIWLDACVKQRCAARLRNCSHTGSAIHQNKNHAHNDTAIRSFPTSLTLIGTDAAGPGAISIRVAGSLNIRPATNISASRSAST